MTSPRIPPAPLERRRYSRRTAIRSGGWTAGGLLLASCIPGGDEEVEPADARGEETAAPSDAARSTPTPSPASTASSSLLADELPLPDAERGVMRQGVAGEAVPPPALGQARLVAVDPRSSEIHGDLALRIEQAGPLDLVVQLRPDAFFHPASGEREGEPVDAAAVARDFTLRAQAREFLFAGALGEIETPEADTLRLRLTAPFALLFELLGDTAIAAIRGEGLSEFGQPLGAGPFIAERREDGGVSLRPHARYHRRGLPMLDELRIVSAEREAALDAAFESGALDIRTLQQADSAARAEQRPGARIFERSTRRARGLGLSLVGTKDGQRVRFHPAFQDERVRRAFFLSIDHQQLATREGDARGSAAGPVGPSFRLDALPRHEIAAHPLFSHDVAEARKLLAAAGVPNLAFAVEAPDQLALAALVRALAEQLRQGGFQPRLSLVSDEQWRRDLAAGDFEAILFELEPVRTPDIGLRLHSSAGLGGFSPWGYSNPLYDLAIERALSALDPVERGRRSRDAQRLLLNDVPALIPLPEPVERVAVSARIAGYEWDAYEFNENWQAARWGIRGSGSGLAPRDADASPAAL